MRYALLQSNIVVNLIEWDGVSEYSIPDDMLIILVGENDVHQGDLYENGLFINPEAPNEQI